MTFFKKIKSIEIKKVLHIKDVVLCDFIEWYFSTDLELLPSNWEDLVMQYEECIGGKDVIGVVKEIKKICLLESKINRANGLMTLIEIKPNEANYAMLFEFNYTLPDLVFSKANAIKLVPIFEGYVKSDLLRLEALLAEFNTKNKTKSKKATREDFIEMIVALSQHFKIQIDENKISVEKYCLFVKRYVQECEMIIKQNQIKK